MKYLSNITLATFVTFVGCSNKSDQPETKIESASIKVESAQCGSCAMTITTALKAVDGVQKADVDIDSKVATVSFVSAKTSLAQLEEAIAKAGYNANGMKADPAAYEKLDACCKVE